MRTKQSFSRLLSILLLFAMLLTNTGGISYAVDAEPHETPVIIDNGSCGDNLTWTLSEDLTLTISGTGTMNNFNWDQPWLERSWEIVKVVVEEGVENIGSSAFRGFEACTEIQLPSTVTDIGEYAFTNCILLPEINLPKKLKTIGEYAFGGCALLTEIKLPDGVTSIGIEAFCSCTALTSIVIPDSVTEIGYGILATCSALQSVTLPKGLACIESAMFAGCRALTGIVIPHSVTIIKDSAFENCTALESITIPAGITAIENFAFDRCDSLTTINYGGTEEQWNAIVVGIKNDVLSDATVNFESYAEPEEPEKPELPGGTCGENLTWTLSEDLILTISGEGEMEHFNWGSQPWADYSSEIVEIIIEAGVESIGSNAFCTFGSLTAIELPETLKTIGEYAFGGCTLLPEIDLPDSLTDIGIDAFCSCSSLTDIVIPDSTTTIAYGAFASCTALQSVTLPKTLTNLESGLFSGCSALTSIVIPEHVSIIKDSAFEGCTALASITIPVSVTEIGSSAFINCENLTTVNYGGYMSQWNAIRLGDKNAPLLNANILCVIFEGPVTTGEELMIAIAQGGEVTIGKDLSLTDVITISGEVTLKAESPVTITTTAENALTVTGTLTLGENITISGTNTALYVNGGTVNIEGAVLTASHWQNSAFRVYNGGTLNLTSGTLSSDRDALTISESQFNMTGGTVSSVNRYALYVNNSSTVTISGGTVISDTYFALNAKNSSTVTITNGDFTGAISAGSEATVTVSGGTFSEALSETYLADGLGCALLKGNTRYTIGVLHSITHSLKFVTGISGTGSVMTAGNVSVGASLSKSKAIAGEEIVFTVTVPEHYSLALKMNGKEVETTDNQFTFIMPDADVKLYAVVEPIPGTPALPGGTCGENLTWALDTDYILTISGTGAMDNYAAAADLLPQSAVPMTTETPAAAPWSEYAALITKVVVQDGVTSIGDNAFAGCETLEEIDIAETVTAIGNSVFTDCEALETVIYRGSEEQWAEVEVGTGNESLADKIEIRDFLTGDLNSDDILNVYDAIDLLSLIANGTSDTMPSDKLLIVDINGDGLVNVYDAIDLLSMIANSAA